MKKNINYHENPNIILAGPGTGKTFTLVRKIIDLQNTYKDNNLGLIVCTFTKKATQELEKRLAFENKFENHERIIGDIHQICLNFLQEYFPEKYQHYSVIDEGQQANFIFQKRSNLNSIDESNITKQAIWVWARDSQEVFNKITDRNIEITDSVKNNMIAINKKNFQSDVPWRSDFIDSIILFSSIKIIALLD